MMIHFNFLADMYVPFKHKWVKAATKESPNSEWQDIDVVNKGIN